MALTSNQRRILSKANSRLSAILEKSGSLEPAIYYSPAAQDALEALEGRTRFSASDLKAAKSFVRKKTSTVKGARKWAAQQGLQPTPPQKPAALTETQRREIDTANKRLAAMRKRGDAIPERYAKIDRFRKDTVSLAREFLQNPNTLKQPRKVYQKLPAKLGQKVKLLADSFKLKQQGDVYYDARESGEIGDDVKFDTFKREATPPSFTGVELERWVKENAPQAYDEILRMTGDGAENYGDYWKIIEEMEFK